MTTKHFNNLSESTLERIAILNEECGEVIQIVGKTLRHGLESHNPHDPEKTTNRQLLEKEIADVLFSVDLMIKNGDISRENLNQLMELKAKNIVPYLHHNQDIS